MSDIVVLAGAGRSGTTILKDVLSEHRDVGSYEFEMNLLWKMGNFNVDHDRLEEKHARNSVCRKINRFINDCAEKSGKKVFIDKTVANVMRLKFVSKVVPNCKIIYLERDGRAVAASAMKRWEKKEKGSYYLRKLSAMPFSAKLHVFISKLKEVFFNRLSKSSKSSQRWGAIWPTFELDVQSKTLAEKCAMQWCESVAYANKDLSEINGSRFIRVKYESLLQDPENEVKRIIKFLNLPEYQEYLDYVNSVFDKGRAENWKKTLKNSDLEKIEEVESGLLSQLGYLQ